MADLTSLGYSWGTPLMRFTTDQGSFTCGRHEIPPPDLAIEIVLFLQSTSCIKKIVSSFEIIVNLWSRTLNRLRI